MKFTPGQLRTSADLSVETYRHWRRVLPAFVKRRGYAPCYSTGDLLAACILRRLTEHCGVRVGNLTDISTEIIRLCNGTAWASLEGAALVIDMDKGRCHIAKGDSVDVADVSLGIVCRFDPILSELRNMLLRTQPPADQTHLKFPPTQIQDGSLPRRRRA